MKGTTYRELRLALRAARTMRRHVSRAVNMNPHRDYELRALRALMKRLGAEERLLVKRIDAVSYPST